MLNMITIVLLYSDLFLYRSNIRCQNCFKNTKTCRQTDLDGDSSMKWKAVYQEHYKWSLE